MSAKRYSIPLLILLLTPTLAILPTHASSQSQACDIATLACKVYTVDNTPGLHIHVSAYLQEEAQLASQDPETPCATNPCAPTHVLSSPLDGSSIALPDVTVNQDSAAAPQNEPAIAVNPNNPSEIAVGMNDYVTRTWKCTISGTPCSALGDGYSGVYLSTDGGSTWCCAGTSTSNLGTLVPGVERLTGGIYDAGGDPSVAFNSQGVIFYAGLGFDRFAAPNTVEVSSGTISSGSIAWGSPTFIDQTTAPSILNDKEWVGVDNHPGSSFQDRVYVSFTRFIFGPTGAGPLGGYVQSPIYFAYSSDGGATFSNPVPIVGNIIYDQGSHIVVGPDGTVYVFWDGSTRKTIDSIWMAKSTDGGVTFSKPVAVAPLIDISSAKDTVFRVNSFPMADIAADGNLYVAWSAEITSGADPTETSLACFGGPAAGCHSAVVYSKSTDGGATWSAPVFAFPSLGSRSAVGYPVTNPDGSVLDAPTTLPAVEGIFPSVAVAPNGNVYISAYEVDLESPWQTCAEPATPSSVGRIDCLTLGPYVNNGRMDYMVTDITTGITESVNTQPINSRYQFGGGFFGDYTGISVGSDNMFHAVWTDSNNVQSVVWWYGHQFVPTSIHQQDIATATGAF